MNWDTFLDSIAEDLGTHYEDQTKPSNAVDLNMGDVTPTPEKAESMKTHLQLKKNQSVVHDAVIEVVVATQQMTSTTFVNPAKRGMPVHHIIAKMIVTIWEFDDERFFSLSFTSTDSSPTSVPSSRGQSRQVVRAATSHPSSQSGSGSNRSPSSFSSGHSSNHSSSGSSAIKSPASVSMSASPFPPMGPPSRSALSSAPSVLQKVIIMKDALLEKTDVPIVAMWKDKSIAIPNKGVY